MDRKLILVTGATGYIAGRLVPLLLERGYRVRCLVRTPQRLGEAPWSGQVESFVGDLAESRGLDRACAGVSAAYYLVHNMASGRGYHARDLAAARAFAAAAATASVEQIVYLGGLADPAASIGRHMRSRIETGETLRQGPVPVTEFRAGVIVGPGSISFEMIRYLTEQLPLLIGPGWLDNRVQPIAATDVLAYLVAALETPASRGRILEIGGAEVLTFAETMRIYARMRGLRRRVWIVPRLPVGLMALAVDRLTPVPVRIAAPLIDGMRADSVVRDEAARRVFPAIRPLAYPQAVARALAQLAPERAGARLELRPKRIKIIKHEGFLIDARRVALEIGPEEVYRYLIQLGGRQGWLFFNGAWKLRGALDRLLGGPGMRGRPGGEHDPRPGDVVDFYRVEAAEPGRLYRLRSELKAPGQAWMEWRADPRGSAGCALTQTAWFAPYGVPGFLYWYLLSPIHRFVFSGLIRSLARQAALRPDEAGIEPNLLEKD